MSWVNVKGQFELLMQPMKNSGPSQIDVKNDPSEEPHRTVPQVGLSLHARDASRVRSPNAPQEEPFSLIEQKNL